MKSIGACALLRVDGDLPVEVLREMLTPFPESHRVSYFTDLSLPTVTEANEEAAWLGMMRLLSIQNPVSEIQVILHRYSPAKALLSVSCEERIATRSRLDFLLRTGMAKLGKELSCGVAANISRDRCDIGIPIDLDMSRCFWDGANDISDSFLAFISSALICQYLLSGHPASGIDILLPSLEAIDQSRLCSLPVTSSLDLTIGGILEKVRSVLNSRSPTLFGNSPRNSTAVIQGEPCTSEYRLQAGSWAVTLMTVRTLGPWRIRLLLPPGSHNSTVECIGIFTPAARLLPAIFHAAQTTPEATIKELTHVLESPHAPVSDRPSTWISNYAKSAKHGGETGHKRITVASIVFGDLPYAAHSRAINERYCAEHGYAYRTIAPPPMIERHPVWYKVQGVKALLEESEFVMFLDADAYFYDHEYKIESLIADHMGDSALMLGTDRRDKDFAFSDEEGNTGVFVLRNCSEAFAILDEWWETPIHDHGAEWLWRWPIEQSVFNHYVRKGKHSNAIRLIHYAWMNGRDGTYIRHLVGTPEEDRLAVLRDAHKSSSSLRPLQRD